MHDSDRVIEAYSDMVYRIVLLRVGDRTAADDAYQNTFLHWLEYSPDFEDAEHEKAWFIRCAINCANDVLRDRSRRRVTALDDCTGEDEPSCGIPEYTGIFDALRRLPEKYAAPLYLYYVEGYDTKGLAKILRITGSGARMRLKRGRELLLKEYTGSEYGEKSDQTDGRSVTNDIISQKQLTQTN